MSNLTFIYRGKKYQILSEVTDVNDVGRAEQLLIDFQWCERIGDWDTIGNRITNGLKWGWLKEISFKEDSDIVQNVEKEVELKGELNEKGFW